MCVYSEGVTEAGFAQTMLGWGERGARLYPVNEVNPKDSTLKKAIISGNVKENRW